MSLDKATLAAGCFWGVEETFRMIPGVVSTRVGYTGGDLENPSYHDVCSDTSGHAEAVEVIFDTDQVKYLNLLDTISFDFDLAGFVLDSHNYFYHGGNLIDVEIPEEKVVQFIKKHEYSLDIAADEFIKKIQLS